MVKAQWIKQKEGSCFFYCKIGMIVIADYQGDRKKPDNIALIHLLNDKSCFLK